MRFLKPSAPTSAAWKWWVCGLLLCASMINYMDRQTLANVAVRITTEFKLSQEQYGNLEWVFGWAFAAGSLLFGFLADVAPVRWLYPAVVLLWSGTGFVTGFTNSFAGLLACRTLLGFFESGHWPCGLKTTQRLLSSPDRAMGNSVLQSGTSLGAVITPLVMKAMLTNEPGSWRLSFQVIGGFSLVWVAAWVWMMRKGEQKKPNVEPLPALIALPVKGEGGTRTSFWEIVWSRRFLALLVMVALINTTWQLLRAWLPKILQQGRGYPEGDVLYFNSLFYVATDVGCLGAGALTLLMSRRGFGVHRGRTVVYLACAVLTALSTVAALLPKGWMLLVCILLVGMGALGVFPCYYAWSQELTIEHQGKVTGLTGVSAWVFSAPVHKYFGRLVDQSGSFDLGLAVVGWGPLLALLFFYFCWNAPEAELKRESATLAIQKQQ